MSLTVKVAFGEENRRITVNKSISYTELNTLLTKLFNGTALTKIEYQDDEKEWIRVSTDLELEEAKRINGINILRLRVNNNTANVNNNGNCKAAPQNNPFFGTAGIPPMGDLISLIRNLLSNVSVEIVNDEEWRGGCPRRGAGCCPFKQQQQQNGEVVHYGFACDGCNQYPLVGVRYRCEQCADFDFCAKCHQKGEHDKTHTFKTIAESEKKTMERW